MLDPRASRPDIAAHAAPSEGSARRLRSLRGLALGLLAVVGLGLSVAALPELSPRETARAGLATRLFLPDLHSQGYTTGPLPADLPTGAARVAAPSGIEGFGFSVVELSNPFDFGTEASLHLDKRGRNPQQERASLAAGETKLLRLGALSQVDDGFWNGILDARDPVAAIVRSDWPQRGEGPSGGTLIYEGQTPARRFLAPLLVRGVDGLYGDYHIMNADDPEEERLNTVRMQFFNATDGGIEAEWEDVLEPGAVINVDSLEFGTALTRLPANLPGGDFVGGFHVQAQYPIVMQMHHNEAFEGGVGSASIRDWDHAVTEQVLPVVRANYLGDTLLGLINREDGPVEVTLRYQGAADSPTHADKEIVQQITMAPRSSAAIDLAGRGMGTVGTPAIDRGGAANTGFLGSARIESTGRVAATVVESSRWFTITRSTAAWNPFVPEDLGEHFLVPATRHVAGQRVTRLAIHNPGDGSVDVRVDYSAVEGDLPATSAQVTVPAGRTRFVSTDGKADFIARAAIHADGPVAVLVYETPFASLADFTNQDNLLDVSAYQAIRIEGRDSATPNVPPTATPQPTATATQALPQETPRAPTATPEGTLRFIFLPWGHR